MLALFAILSFNSQAWTPIMSTHSPIRIIKLDKPGLSCAKLSYARESSLSPVTAFICTLVIIMYAFELHDVLSLHWCGGKQGGLKSKSI